MLHIDGIFSGQSHAPPALCPGGRYMGDMLILPPHPALRPYIAHYSLAATGNMAPGTTVLPTASNSLIYSIGERGILGGLRGVNSRAVEIASYARSVSFMLLVEFHPGGLHPFLPIHQGELLDGAFAFGDLDRGLDGEMKSLLEKMTGRKDFPAGLAGALDDLFLSRFGDLSGQKTVEGAMALLQRSGGRRSVKSLAAELHYSEKQLGRLFRQHVGTGVKTFARILRMKRALSLLGRREWSLERVGWECGYSDGPHFLRDFTALAGVGPGEYRRKMALFYNDPFKLEGGDP